MMNYYVYWKQTPTGRYQDDIGLRYDVSVITEPEYNLKPDVEKSKYKLHWAKDRFTELAGLKELFPGRHEHNVFQSSMFQIPEKKATEIAVILTTWKRIDRLEETLRQIQDQTFKDFDLYVINNNPSLTGEINEVISRFSMNITLYHSRANLGFINRHLLAKELAASYPFIIMLDDDLDIKKNAFSVLNSEKKKKTIKSILALNFKSFFYDQQEEKEAKPSKYVGPGGMICDSSLFLIPEFWSEWELEYYLIDDFWVSYFAGKLGWECGKSLAPMILKTDGDDGVKTYKKNAVMLLRNDFVEKYKWTSIFFKNDDPRPSVLPAVHKKSMKEILEDRQRSSDEILKRKISNVFSVKKRITIFEVGSCECEDSVKYAKWFPNSKIFAFEPVKNNQEIGKKRIIDENLLDRIELVPCACGDVKGEVEIKVSSGRPSSVGDEDPTDYGNKSSSLLRPKKHLEVHPWCKFETTQKTEVIRLEDFCANRGIAEIDFLHLDVQGFEKNVLVGMGKMLKKTEVVFLEVENIELYEGQPTKKEIESFLSQNGFVKLHDSVGSVSGDQLWKKKNNLQLNPMAVLWR